MRLASLAWLSGLAALGWIQTVHAADASEGSESTVFNSITVPPMLELTPSNWDEEIKKSKWLFIKHYSPWCIHCKHFAPTFQTAYEFYYTSEAPAKENFEKKYDFRFATINCVAFGDLCVEHKVQSYPTTVLYEDGEVAKRLEGGQTMNEVRDAIEEALEKTKPGSRPKDIEMPKPGAKEFKSKTSVAAPAAPAAPVNEDGISVDLTSENFARLVTLSQEPWLIKFYAPWCPHCRDMAPTWEQLAKTMRGKLHIGEVNCDNESRLCKDVHAKAYPTILFFKGGERSEYEGLRGLGDFIQYAEKALDLASGVPDVDVNSFKALEEKEEVIFVYFYDHATTSEDFRALERLPLSLIGHAKLVKTKDPAMFERFKITTWPRLMVAREGRPTYYPPLTPGAMRDVNQVLNWMKSVWLPLVPELLVTNANQIMDGKIVVLAVLNRDDQDAFQGALREMKSAANEWMDRQILEFQLERKKLRDAKQMRIEEAEDRDDQRALRAAKAIHIDMDSSGRKEVGFAWVDGMAWQRWIRTTFGIDVKDGEKIIINDEDNRKYWDNTVTGNYILVSRTSVLETLDKIVYSPHLLKHKLTVSFVQKIFIDIRNTFTDHPYICVASVAGIAYVGLQWFRGRPRRARGHFRLDSTTLNAREFKETFLAPSSSANKSD